MTWPTVFSGAGAHIFWRGTFFKSHGQLDQFHTTSHLTVTVNCNALTQLTWRSGCLHGYTYKQFQKYQREKS